MKTIEKVHVIPLGFERDIAVLPIRVLGGVRAHIITIGGEFAEKYDLHEEQRFFEKAVVRDLKNMGIDVLVHYADLFDFQEVLKVLSRVIKEEKELDSEVYLNLSSHGRLVSIASALVGWYHDVRMYYVLASRYAKSEEEFRQHGRSVCERVQIFEVPKVEIVKLNDEEKLAMSLIYSKGKGYARLNEIAEVFCKKFPQIYSCSKDKIGEITRKSKQELLTKLNRRVLSKLESRGYVEREKVGRNTILRITEKGKLFALLEGDS